MLIILVYMLEDILKIADTIKKEIKKRNKIIIPPSRSGEENIVLPCPYVRTHVHSNVRRTL